jgi:HPt (histidine-containing phosphotransfer) domain-containing protein
MGSERAVDLDHLDRYTGGDRSLNEEILRLFDNQCMEMVTHLEALAAGTVDLKRWKEITHTLKGAARGIGAFALADAAAAAEPLAQDPSMLEAVQRLKAKSEAVHGFIEEFLRQA